MDRRDPPQGRYEGTVEMYMHMQGLGFDGGAIINPITGENTTLCLDGDPVAQTGWYMGNGWPGGPDGCDVRGVMSSVSETITDSVITVSPVSASTVIRVSSVRSCPKADTSIAKLISIDRNNVFMIFLVCWLLHL